MSINSKKPFKNKSFYLDLRYQKSRPGELAKAIKKLGGRLESFLSKEVTHVITDREFPKCSNFWTPLTPNSAMSNSTASQIHSPLDYPVIHASPSAFENCCPFMSRGQALVQKAKQKHTGTSDIFDICHQWKIKVLHIKKIQAVISKFKTITARKCSENQAPKCRTTSDSNFFKRELTGSFIKIEDTKMQYCSSHKVFKNLKDSFDSDFLRALAKVCRSKDPASKFNSTLSSSGSIFSDVLNVSSPTTLLYQPSPLGNSNRLNTPTPQVSKKILQMPTNTKIKKERKPTVRRRYCEICKCSFTEIGKHLATDKHQTFLEHPLNFKKVEQLISLFPSLEDFIKQHDEQIVVNSPATTRDAGDCPKQSLDPKSTLNQSIPKDENFNLVNSDETEMISESFSSNGSSEEFPYLSGPGFKKQNKFAIAVSPCKENTYANDCTKLDSQNKLDVNDDEPPKLQLMIDPNTCPNFSLKKECQLIIDSLSENISSKEHGAPLKEERNGDMRMYCTDIVEDQLPEIDGPYLLTNNATLQNNSVLRTFPFTNFGFGWNSFPLNEEKTSVQLKEVNNFNPEKNSMDSDFHKDNCDKNCDISGETECPLDLSIKKLASDI